MDPNMFGLGANPNLQRSQLAGPSGLSMPPRVGMGGSRMPGLGSPGSGWNTVAGQPNIPMPRNFDRAREFGVGMGPQMNAGNPIAQQTIDRQLGGVRPGAMPQMNAVEAARMQAPPQQGFNPTDPRNAALAGYR